MSLVNVLNQLEEVDQELQKEAAEMNKIAAEEDAAGRIMARGFMAELYKLGGLLSPEISPGAAREHGKGMVQEGVKQVSEKLGPHKKDIAGLAGGALTGRALLGKGRGPLGALLGLLAVRHKDVGEAAKGVAEKAKEFTKSRKG